MPFKSANFKFTISRGTSNMFSENNIFLFWGQWGGQTRANSASQKMRDVTQKMIRHSMDKKTFVTETNLRDQKNPKGWQFSDEQYFNVTRFSPEKKKIREKSFFLFAALRLYFDPTVKRNLLPIRIVIFSVHQAINARKLVRPQIWSTKSYLAVVLARRSQQIWVQRGIPCFVQ